MDNRHALTQEQSLGLRFTQAQLRFTRMLEMSAPELEEAVARELDENPALEADDQHNADVPQQALTIDGETFNESADDLMRADYRPDDIPYYRLNARNSSPDDVPREIIPVNEEESLYDILDEQLGELPLEEDVAKMARYIVRSLDNNGYLRRPLSNLIDDLTFSTGIEPSQQTAQKALEAVRSLEPHGVGASDLRDCLLLQLRFMPQSIVRDDAINIIENQFEAFSMKHTHRIISGLHISAERVKEALDLILSLNPKPGAPIGGSDSIARPIIPDFSVSNTDGILSVAVNNNIPDLRIEESFEQAVARMERNNRRRKADADSRFISTRYNSAREFIQILKQRQETLFAVMTAIVEIQREFFLSSDARRIRPMTIRDVAERSGYDISVISRSTNGKYVATDTEILPLRFLFSSDIGAEGETSGRLVQEEMKSLIEAENKKHPLSDEKIRLMLGAKGLDISRRTVAKYRDRLGIPVARLRKSL